MERFSINYAEYYVNDFYPKIKSIIGSPLFNITVNVRLDVNISYAGLYFPSINEMVLDGLHADVFVTKASMLSGMIILSD